MTFDRDDLRAAVSADLLSAAQASRLEQFMLSRRGAGNGSAIQDGSESLRFLSNFNDIFITLGLIILFSGVTTFVGLSVAPIAATSGLLSGLLMAVPVGGLAWLMLEYFCRRRRMLLPSMVLTIIFVTASASAGAAIFASTMGDVFNDEFFSAFKATGHLGQVSFASAAVAAFAVFWRFRLPFSLAVLALALAGLMYISFGFAGLIGYVVGGTQALTLLAVLVVLGLISLALNRRALIAASILTFMFTLTFVLGKAGVDGATIFIMVAIIIGGGVVLLGAGWKTARRAVLAMFPRNGIWARLFPPELA